MGILGDGRARNIARSGRDMTLSRADKSASVSLLGYAPPAQIAADQDGVPVQQFICQVGLVSGLYGLPKKNDKLRDGPKLYTLTDATPVYEGGEMIGWTLIAAGGS